LVQAELRTAPTLEVLRRRRLDRMRPGAIVDDVAPDGRSLLLRIPVGLGNEVRVVVHWATSIRRALLAPGAE
jgi:hypothetical protein